MVKQKVFELRSWESYGGDGDGDSTSLSRNGEKQDATVVPEKISAKDMLWSKLQEKKAR